jgi:hypothetical protein
MFLDQFIQGLDHLSVALEAVDGRSVESRRRQSDASTGTSYGHPMLFDQVFRRLTPVRRR